MVIKADSITLSGTTDIMGLRKVSVQYTTASTYNALVVNNDQKVYQVQKNIGELIVDIATKNIKIYEVTGCIIQGGFTGIGTGGSTIATNLYFSFITNFDLQMYNYNGGELTRFSLSKILYESGAISAQTRILCHAQSSNTTYYICGM